MPRNVSGNYSLPLPPVVADTTIEADWANTTDDDLAQALTDSLDRAGRGGMTAPLKLVDGTEALPGLTFNSQSGTGVYRGSAVLGFSHTGVTRMLVKSSPGFHVGDNLVDATSGGVGNYIRPRLTSGNATQYGTFENTMFSTSANLAAYGVNVQSRFADGAYVTPTYAAVRVQTPVLGAGHTITNLYGVQIPAMVGTGRTAGVYSDMSAGTDRWFLYGNGTAPSKLNGDFEAANVTSGIYAPVCVPGTNVTAVTASLFYMRVGNVVSVAGQIVITFTVAGVRSNVYVPLPIASAVTGGAQVAGTFAGTASNDTNAGAVIADAPNDRANLTILSQNTGAQSFQVQFNYIIV